MASALTVSGLNEQIKTLLEATFEFVSVEGELSRVTKHGSGHIYFTLKDADSSIKGVMFKGNAARLKFLLEEGAHVVLHGALSLYKPRGEYQINVVSAEPFGTGALAVAFEQLKQKLEYKGYFDSARKKPFPKFPQVIVLVTSATSAALQDMQRVAAGRWPLVKLIVLDVLVQGSGAAAQIAQALKYADTLYVDAVVVGRGGGSIEDLWPFNEEIVADAIFEMKTPVVSAVGHEIDWVISDYAADMRAPTPSAAMQMLLPDKDELLLALDEFLGRLMDASRQILYQKEIVLKHRSEELGRFSLDHMLRQFQETFVRTEEEYRRVMLYVLTRFASEILPIQRALQQQIGMAWDQKSKQRLALEQRYLLSNPKNGLKEGWAKIYINGKNVGLEMVDLGDQITLEDATTKIKVLCTDKIKY
jgi:exodeoxyribonuclease VII large subunit